MGTVYYAFYNYCEHCERVDKLCIGKLSVGFKPALRAHYKKNFSITSWCEWKKFLNKPGVVIKDEYGTTIFKDEFIERVEDWQESHEDYCYSFWDDCFIDKDGYEFIELEVL